MTEALYHACTSKSSSSVSASSSSLLSGSGSTCRLMERTSSCLASEYARTSEEMMGYVSFLEGSLERVRADIHRFQQEAVDAREHATLANHRLILAHRHAQALSQQKDQAIEGAHHCKEQLHLTQALLVEEQLRIKPELSSGSCKEEYTNWSSEIDKEAKGRFKRQHREGCSPRSILKAVHEELHHLLDAGASDHSGGSCEAHDQPESERFLSKDSKVKARAHHKNGHSPRKKRPLTRFPVPPLHLPGIRNSSSFCIHRAHDSHEDDGGHEREVRLDDSDYDEHSLKKKKQDKATAWDLVPMKTLVNKRQAERKEIQQCQTDIMKTLRGLKENMGYLLDLEERSHFK